MDLRTYVAVLVRHWIVLLVAVVLGLGTALAVVLLTTPQYTSTARLVFSPTGAESGQDLAYAGNYVQGRMQTWKGVATSPAVLQPVIDDLGLETTPAELAEHVSVASSQIDALLEVSVTDQRAPQAARVSNAVADELLHVVDELEDGQVQGGPGVDGRVVGPATAAADPSQPRTWFDLLVGLMLGGFAGVLVVSAAHLLRAEE